MSQTTVKGMDKALCDLLPFLQAADEDTFLSYVEEIPADFLRQFYVFDVSSIAVPDGIDDVQHFVEQQYRSILSAAHRASWTVLTAIVGSKSGTRVSLGFVAEAEGGQNDPYVFERTLRGLLPGLDGQFDYDRTKNAETLLSKAGCSYGGLIVGMPTIRVDDERHYFSLPSILRGMYEEKYVLMLVSRPVPNDHLGKQLQAIWKVRDECHKGARRTRQRGHGRFKSTNEAYSYGGTVSARLFILSMALTVNFSRGQASGESSNEALSSEEQDSLLLEVERLADDHGNRLLRAVNVGAWETSITFATATAPGRDILAGLLLGELAKPSTVVAPLRLCYEKLTDDRLILLPCRDGDGVSGVFPSALAFYLTSEEVAALSAPPSENLPGYEVRRAPALSLTDAGGTATREEASLGRVCDYGRALNGIHISLGSQDLAKHLFVCGLTGSGKTTTVKEMLAHSGVPFLVLESAKRDYRKLLGCSSLESGLRVFTPGDTSIAPLRFNPFHILPGLQAGIHIDYLKAIFNASFSLYGPMPYIVEQCLHNIYLKRGWDLTAGTHPQLINPDGSPDTERYGEQEAQCYFPTLLDLREEVDDYVRSQLDYQVEASDNIRTAIITRLDSLAVGAKGLLFNSSKPLDVEALLAHPTVLELEALSDDDDKAFVVGLLLTFISEYRQINDLSRNPWAEADSELRHVLVIEEAHRLLRNVVQERQTEQLGNPRGKAVEFFANVISEMRSMGQGVIVVEQIPSKLLPDVIKNTNTKIVHRLVSRDDQVLLASTLSLEERESLYLTSLQTGHAICAKEGMQRPIEIKVEQSVPSKRISDEKVRKEMALGTDDEVGTMAIRSVLGRDDALAKRLLCTLACDEPSYAVIYSGKAVAEVDALLSQHGSRHSESSIKRYLTTKIVELLAYGDFQLADDNVRGATSIVERIMDGDDEAGDDFRQQLAKGWNTKDVCDGAIHRICKLVRDRVRQEGVSVYDAKAVSGIVKSCFIADLSDVRYAIIRQIKAQYDGSARYPTCS